MKKNYIILIYQDNHNYYLTTNKKWSDQFYDDKLDDTCIFENYTEDEIKKIIEEERKINNIARYTYEEMEKQNEIEI